ncbi:hypothetical protein [Salinibaculum rarum]|uniref:hypothetical protein n=1 Tax=Salinibaculum rarum TaxID=3058903 RepID=UPI00265FCDE8|nr:hypothetical protein [Salinibaculum sp. KK48]
MTDSTGYINLSLVRASKNTHPTAETQNNQLGIFSRETGFRVAERKVGAQQKRRAGSNISHDARPAHHPKYSHEVLYSTMIEDLETRTKRRIKHYKKIHGLTDPTTIAGHLTRELGDEFNSVDEIITLIEETDVAEIEHPEPGDETQSATATESTTNSGTSAEQEPESNTESDIPTRSLPGSDSESPTDATTTSTTNRETAGSTSSMSHSEDTAANSDSGTSESESEVPQTADDILNRLDTTDSSTSTSEDTDKGDSDSSAKSTGEQHSETTDEPDDEINFAQESLV